MRIIDKDINRPTENFLSPLNAEVQVFVDVPPDTFTRFYYFKSVMSTDEITQKVRERIKQDFSARKEVSFTYKLYDIG